MSLSDASEKTKQFRNRVQSAIQTAQAWDDDPLLLLECRCLIPFAQLADDNGIYSETSDMIHSQNYRFLQRLARFFKRDVMTWVNEPACEACETQSTKHQTTRGPETMEEREGSASRVEVYICNECNALTTFPRYNSPRKLLETRKGRCGEYANLFGLYLRACGLDTRYVCDWTDHVWNEVYLDGSWLMVDACEGVVDEPSMYEAGWNKQLNMIVAATKDHVLDVTPRYTRNFHQADFQARRRSIISTEAECKVIIKACSAILQRGFKPKVRNDLDQRLLKEAQMMDELKSSSVWEKEYDQGRLSGSLVWKVLRREAGAKQDGDDDAAAAAKAEQHHAERFGIETFYPPVTGTVKIQVNPHPKTPHHGIVVSGVACAVGNPNTLSVVVIDETYLGCILQSRSFQSLQRFADFVDSMPKNRIVVVQGRIPDTPSSSEDPLQRNVQRLAGFRTEYVANGVLFIGVVSTVPCSWTVCASFAEAPRGLTLQSTSFEQRECKLARFDNVRPACVVGRLPESFMPLSLQLGATLDEKIKAFEHFMKNQHASSACAGFTTKNNTSIYLLGASAFPMTKVSSSRNESWTTCLRLPPPLVPKDAARPDLSSKRSSGSFEVPINHEFYIQLLGSQLIKKPELQGPTAVDTASALSGSRLVALYFSAHWCGPCRSFTPMLAGMYSHLKEVFSTHGLEVVFVSSDRDQASFFTYFASMPWLAIPFSSVVHYKDMLSRAYGIRGVPSIVVLDSLSGNVVSDNLTARGEILQACRSGEHGIEALLQSWFNRVPEATKEMIKMLKISCVDDMMHRVTEGAEESVPYLHRIEKEPVEAADGADSSSSGVEFVLAKDEDIGPTAVLHQVLSRSERTSVNEVLKTALAYIKNAAKAPYNPKYRCVKLSNKVADCITRANGGVELIQSLGFDIIAMDNDFYATILLATNLDEAGHQVKDLLRQLQRA
ncbi:hypothetical protein MPSEU_000100100 [Mayamaea pseudoterrestris]|nr:hypothetical protein MPSEU_000100100 [Mayamaea pseudoterrestris]